jgi:2-polyprenyl-3-methyl-5-hydroxy-6-metoxy-1,4-benzoquinol methylase
MTRIATVDELFEVLDNLTASRADATSRAASEQWAEILRRPGHPLNTDLPDVNLLSWHERGLLPGEGKRALDVGCGLGRNARWLAAVGYDVAGIDIASAALAEAVRRTGESEVEFVECDVLREQVPGGPYDLVYDSGCFHHLAPHRRISYLQALDGLLAPGGLYGVCTFTAGEMGSTASDRELLVEGGFGEGIGYTVDELAGIFRDLNLVHGDALSAFPGEGFTQTFLTAALFRR